jgi:hypothetical protein
VASPDFNTNKDYNKRVVAVSKIFAEIGYNPKMPGKVLFGEKMGGELMEKIELTPEQESRYHQAAGVFAMQGGIKGFETMGVEDLLEQKPIQNLIKKTIQGDNLAKELLHMQIDSVFRQAKQAARAYMLTKDPDFSDELSLKRQNQIRKATKLLEGLQ